MKIKRTKKVMDVDVKRFYVPYSITDKCPDCGEVCECDEYLSYPRIGAPHAVYFWCPECGHEWQQSALMDISLKRWTG